MGDSINWTNRRNLDGSIVNIGSSVVNSHQSVNIDGGSSVSNIRQNISTGVDDTADLHIKAFRIAVVMQNVAPFYFKGDEQAKFNRFIITIQEVIEHAGKSFEFEKGEAALSATYGLINRMIDVVDFEELDRRVVDKKLDKFMVAFYGIDPIIYKAGNTSPGDFLVIVRSWFKNCETALIEKQNKAK